MIFFLIEAGDKGRQLLIRVRIRRVNSGLTFENAALSEHEDLDGNPTALEVIGEDISIVVVLAHNNLTLDSGLNVLELVPVIGGLFEVQALGGGLHLVLELSHNRLNITVEELLNLLNLLLVHVLGDFMIAGANALT